MHGLKRIRRRKTSICYVFGIPSHSFGFAGSSPVRYLYATFWALFSVLKSPKSISLPSKLVYLTLYSFVSDHWPMSASPISSMAFRVRMSLLLYLQFCELWKCCGTRRLSYEGYNHQRSVGFRIPFFYHCALFPFLIYSAKRSRRSGQGDWLRSTYWHSN
jgi:hypothetical protein